MKPEEERDMHEWAVKLEELTRGTGWAAMQYGAIASVLKQLTKFCDVSEKPR